MRAIINNIRRILFDDGRDDRDFTEQEQRLQEVLAHLHAATNSVRKGAELLADLIKARN
ncbi:MULTISPECIES: hypothetical protein [Bradyrhizobium]|uniref:Uncharacterized protein n=1 Tax=Bradyrhizobium barranii subsp. barranii TaxID=2823807 RepID=A0A7Z0QKB8_9BRAD|nr:hypothetical protein [Bradyrhizobium barranii]UGX98213.1 hypothetical protein G6321_00025050 [Bradyrhizobium barranii subsp. barranii]